MNNTAENLTAFRAFTQGFFDELRPVGIVEQQLVRRLADTSWRLNRVTPQENNLLAMGFPGQDEIRHQDPKVRAALVEAGTFRANLEAFEALSVHGDCLSRQFEAILRQLSRLQANRRRNSRAQAEPAVI
ncbi:MAG: hypothetical protein M3O35_00020 [Acidobacteriota bacterium]|nr:hypothetical protein [Acidobacteriota bacterium]